MKILELILPINRLISFKKSYDKFGYIDSKIPIKLFRESDNYYYFRVDIQLLGSYINRKGTVWDTNPCMEYYRYNIPNKMCIHFNFQYSLNFIRDLTDGHREDYSYVGKLNKFEIHKDNKVLESENLIFNKYCRLLKIKKCAIIKELEKEVIKSVMLEELKK